MDRYTARLPDKPRGPPNTPLATLATSSYGHDESVGSAVSALLSPQAFTGLNVVRLCSISSVTNELPI